VEYTYFGKLREYTRHSLYVHELALSVISNVVTYGRINISMLKLLVNGHRGQVCTESALNMSVDIQVRRDATGRGMRGVNRIASLRKN
jgi:hypothetical protein